MRRERDKVMCARMRKAGKKKVGVWLTEIERKMLSEAADKIGITQTDLIKQAIEDAHNRMVKMQKKGFPNEK
jgi:hypothetical protein